MASSPLLVQQASVLITSPKTALGRPALEAWWCARSSQNIARRSAVHLFVVPRVNSRKELGRVSWATVERDSVQLAPGR